MIRPEEVDVAAAGLAAKALLEQDQLTIGAIAVLLTYMDVLEGLIKDANLDLIADLHYENKTQPKRKSISIWPRKGRQFFLAR